MEIIIRNSYCGMQQLGIACITVAHTWRT